MWAQVVVLAVMFVGWYCFLPNYRNHGGIVPATLLWWCAAFVALRFFDIVKVWPADWVDKSLKNGFGVMLDDLVVALFSITVLVGA